jgi:hypothetical protein
MPEALRLKENRTSTKEAGTNASLRKLSNDETGEQNAKESLTLRGEM